MIISRLHYLYKTYPRRPKHAGLLILLYNTWDEKLSRGGQTLVSLLMLSLFIEFLPGLTWAAGFAVMSIIALTFSFLMSLRSIPQIQIKACCPSLAVEGSSVLARFELQNTSLKSIPSIGIRLYRLKDGLVSKKTSTFFNLNNSDPRSLELQLEVNLRGNYLLKEIYLLQSDPLGLFYKRMKIEINWELSVVPQSRSHQVVPWRHKLFSENLHKHHLLGIQSQYHFKGMRPFQKGDSKKLIHHKSWAKSQNPIVKDFHYQRPTPNIKIIIDLHLDSIWNKLSFEYLLQYLINFQQELLNQNYDFSLETLQGNQSTSKKDLHLIHRTLAEIKSKTTHIASTKSISLNNPGNTHVILVFSTKGPHTYELNKNVQWVEVNDTFTSQMVSKFHTQLGFDGTITS